MSPDPLSFISVVLSVGFVGDIMPKSTKSEDAEKESDPEDRTEFSLSLVTILFIGFSPSALEFS